MGGVLDTFKMVAQVSDHKGQLGEQDKLAIRDMLNKFPPSEAKEQQTTAGQGMLFPTANLCYCGLTIDCKKSTVFFEPTVPDIERRKRV